MATPTLLPRDRTDPRGPKYGADATPAVAVEYRGGYALLNLNLISFNDY